MTGGEFLTFYAGPYGPRGADVRARTAEMLALFERTGRRRDRSAGDPGRQEAAVIRRVPDGAAAANVAIRTGARGRITSVLADLGIGG
jgi:hypothetical protein